ncbi:MAG: exopolysaccharide biosynthesis polyprenyl glycosylphosphotransferase, partial [Actinomycetota bacterium]|nr:exopolysaccharide biosynthesis polyprenyl glycosylphosphotransferase [Actinomycetota bacterium]
SRTALIIKATDFDEHELWNIVLEAGRYRRPVFLHSSVRSVGLDRLTVRELGGHTIVRIRPPRFSGMQAFEKRSLDIVGSALALVLLSPLVLTIALAILVTSGRPILFKQPRVGKDGRVFTMLKFRTMRAVQENVRLENHSDRYVDAAERVTSVGRFLRRTSLDELPQFCNVLVGDMSLVGPRPEEVKWAGIFGNDLSEYNYRHRIRPGITGWAQAHGLRGDTQIGPRVELDNWYIEHWNLGLDLQIIFRTIHEVLRGENAY